METYAGTTQGEFFFDRKYFQELLQNFQATWGSLDRIWRLSASSYTILLMFWSTNWKTCLFIYSFFSPKVFCPDVMRLCGIIEGNEILELELKSSASWIRGLSDSNSLSWVLIQLRNKHKRWKDKGKSSGFIFGSVALDGRAWIWGQIDFLSFSPRIGFWMTHIRKCESIEWTNASAAWCEKNCCPSAS